MSTTDKPLIDESEWQAQERGMRAALQGNATGREAMDVTYRIVASALNDAPRSEPPPDFAVDVAKRVARDEAGVERLLSRILLVVFVLASIIVCARYGEQWWQPLERSSGEDALGWMLAVAGCVALSWTGHQLLALARLAGTSHSHAS